MVSLFVDAINKKRSTKKNENEKKTSGKLVEP